MRKYVQDFETWQVNKLNCSVPLPEKLDLEAFRAYVPPAPHSPSHGFMSLTHTRTLLVLHSSKGLQAGETELPSGAAAAAAETVEPDAAIVAQLTAFGFSENACKRAVRVWQASGLATGAVAKALTHVNVGSWMCRQSL